MLNGNLWGSEVDNRRTVFQVVLLVIIIAGAIFVANNWMAGYHVYALVELVVVLLSAALLFIVKKTPHFTLWCSVYLFILFSVILLGIYQSSYNSALYSWLFIVPVLSYLLLGTKLGTVYTSLYMTGGVLALIYAQLLNNPNIYPITIANIALTLAGIWALSYTYENKRAKMVQRLQTMASIDPLTGLNNRLLLSSIFENLCKEETKQPRSLSMLLLDLDHFKAVNDKHGHDMGDQVLVEVAQLLASVRRQSDWAFRFGGEEFCLLIPDANELLTLQIAERLRVAVQNADFECDTPIKVSVSIGIARWPEDGNTLSQVYKCADERLYKAKGAGRNNVVSSNSPASTLPPPLSS